MNPFATFPGRHTVLRYTLALLFSAFWAGPDCVAQFTIDQSGYPIDRDFRFSFGIAAGYGALAMDDVNQHLQEVSAALAALDIQKGMQAENNQHKVRILQDVKATFNR